MRYCLSSHSVAHSLIQSEEVYPLSSLRVPPPCSDWTVRVLAPLDVLNLCGDAPDFVMILFDL